MIYFASRPSAPDLIKIGFSENIDRRMTQMQSSFEDGIDLLAQCDGDERLEASFHAMFEADRVEGEWFRSSHTLRVLIDTLSDGGRRTRRFQKQRIGTAEEGFAMDQSIAVKLLKRLAGLIAPDQPAGRQQESCFSRLASMNSYWSRRRVRSIWELSARRIDFFEVRDLSEAILAEGGDVQFVRTLFSLRDEVGEGE